jgi:Flp pilus assembly pilin Flp
MHAWWKDQTGSSAVEYGLIAAAIAAVIAIVVFALGGYVKGNFQTTCDNIQSTGTSTSGSDCNG